MDASEFRALAAHMEWADASTWRAVRRFEAAQRDERLRWLLHHAHLVQRIYLQAWRGDAFVLTELASYPDLASIEAWARPYYPELSGYAGTLTDERLRAPATFPPEWMAMIQERFPGPPAVALSDTAWQVFSHSTYHRGQIATRIRELGGEPPPVDYIYWAWVGRPGADWDATST